MLAIAAAAIAAAGLVLSSYITARVQKVQRTVNGRMQELHTQIDKLHQELDRVHRRMSDDTPSRETA